MHSLWSAAVQYTNYGTGGAFELPTQSGTYSYKPLQGIYNVTVTLLGHSVNNTVGNCQNI